MKWSKAIAGTPMVAAALALSAAAASRPPLAHACGGFFCSQASPVNQAAEQIIFSHNPDGTVTAVIQIMYEGPSERFAWVLPVPGVPDVAVSSDQALDRLKQNTNPLYQLQTVFEGDCFGARGGFMAQASSGPTTTAPPAQPGDSGTPVMVEAQGNVGPYDYVVISLDPALSSPADVAVDWLTDNGYDVTGLGREVLGPYLEDGLNLLAFRLTKGNSSGSIRPVMISYESSLPMIPIRPTAVAANKNMGVLVWVLGKSRAIPKNYKALELNEALIDWFNPNNNYNEVVSRAADEAQGQGFVTEFARTTDGQMEVIFPEWERQQWEKFASIEFSDPVDMINQALQSFGSWDGFGDALGSAVTLPEGVTPEDFRLCYRCYADEPGFAFDTNMFLQRLYEYVVKPMIATQELLDSRPYLTRLYTTMSADEMTLDPLFDFNSDLADVDNVHVADRVVECSDDASDPSTAPWRVELPQGDVVRGTEFGVWPVQIDDVPAALRIMQLTIEGQGEVLDDRSAMVTRLLGGGSAIDPDEPTTTPSDKGTSVLPGGRPSGSPTSEDDPSPEASSDGGGCSIGGTGRGGSLGLVSLALLGLARRRRGRTAARPRRG